MALISDTFTLNVTVTPPDPIEARIWFTPEYKTVTIQSGTPYAAGFRYPLGRPKMAEAFDITFVKVSGPSQGLPSGSVNPQRPQLTKTVNNVQVDVGPNEVQDGVVTGRAPIVSQDHSYTGTLSANQP